ncbi:MAG: PD-(D/E)XK nuclease family protein [Clostridia bacterium]|nr:PD-(D/E)XK nuclease family protein [Clostridia bacterium]
MMEKQYSGADVGTLTHLILSLTDLQLLRNAENMYEAIEQEIARMVEHGIITEGESQLVNKRSIAQFYVSDIGMRMLASPKVKREWSFTYLLQEGTMVQGIIDCAFMEDDAWVLVDYKTDHIDDEAAFAEKYNLQLGLYAEAVEQITHTRVKEKWLFALRLQKPLQLV